MQHRKKESVERGATRGGDADAPEATFRALLDCLPHAVLLLDREADIVALNAPAGALLGAAPAALVGAQFTRLLTPAAAERLARVAAALDRPVTEEWSLRRDDGELVPVKLTLAQMPRCSLIVATLEPSAHGTSRDVRFQAGQRVRELTSLLPHLVWTAMPDGTCDLLNHRWVEFTGVPVEQQLGWGWLQQVHPDDLDGLTAAARRSMQRGDIYGAEFRLRRHDGVYRWFVTRGVPLRNEQGEIEKWVGANTEVHELHELRERLRAEQERLATIVDTSPAAVISFTRDAQGQRRSSFVSSRALDLYGCSAEEVQRDPDTLFARVHPDDLSKLQEALDAAEREGAPLVHAYRYQHPSRGEIWHEARAASRTAADGSTLWCSVVTDITERKRAEDELTLMRDQLESALEAADMGAWIWDRERDLLWGTEGQRALWRLPADAPAWCTPTLIGARMHPDDVARVTATTDAAMAAGEPLTTEFRILVPGGGERWISSRGHVQKGADGRVLRIAGVNLDVTAQKLAAEAALRSQKLSALGTLAGGIAHDFNNLLFAISGNAALVRASMPDDAEQLTLLDEILSASRRATDLVRQILAFSRPQGPQHEAVRLAEPVREALQLVRASIPATVEIHAEIERDAPYALIDAARMVQVVINLCTNAAHAIKQTDRRGKITVRLAGVQVQSGDEPPPPGKYALLTVEDDGCGMDEATQARIFDPFFTTKPPGEGTGLGLSVVHGIMQSIAGHLFVSSTVGKGSTFRLYVPAVQPPRPQREARPPTPLPRRAGPAKRVLFVDDEPMLVNLGKAYLTRLGYEPAAYQDPHAALAAFRADPRGYDAAMTDLSMPTLSGFELVRELLAIRPDLPVLMMSGFVGPEEHKIAGRLGIRATVLKPLELDAMGRLLAELIA